MADVEEKVRPARAFVTHAGQEEEEIVEIRRFVTEPAKVSVELGMTVNLGNYEFAKVTVGLEAPCYIEEIDATAEWARSWVERKTLAVVGQAREFIKSREPASKDDLPF